MKYSDQSEHRDRKNGRVQGRERKGMAREPVLSGHSCSIWENKQVPEVDETELMTQNCTLHGFIMVTLMLYSFTTIKNSMANIV